MTEPKKTTKHRDGSADPRARLERDKCPLCGMATTTVYGELNKGDEYDVYWCSRCLAKWPTEWNTTMPPNTIEQYSR